MENIKTHFNVLFSENEIKNSLRTINKLLKGNTSNKLQVYKIIIKNTEATVNLFRKCIDFDDQQQLLLILFRVIPRPLIIKSQIFGEYNKLFYDLNSPTFESQSQEFLRIFNLSNKTVFGIKAYIKMQDLEQKDVYAFFNVHNIKILFEKNPLTINYREINNFMQHEGAFTILLKNKECINIEGKCEFGKIYEKMNDVVSKRQNLNKKDIKEDILKKDNLNDKENLINCPYVNEEAAKDSYSQKNKNKSKKHKKNVDKVNPISMKLNANNNIENVKEAKISTPFKDLCLVNKDKEENIIEVSKNLKFTIKSDNIIKRENEKQKFIEANLKENKNMDKSENHNPFDKPEKIILDNLNKKDDEYINKETNKDILDDSIKTNRKCINKKSKARISNKQNYKCINDGLEIDILDDSIKQNHKFISKELKADQLDDSNQQNHKCIHKTLKTEILNDLNKQNHKCIDKETKIDMLNHSNMENYKCINDELKTDILKLKDPITLHKSIDISLTQYSLSYIEQPKHKNAFKNELNKFLALKNKFLNKIRRFYIKEEKKKISVILRKIERFRVM